MSLSLVLAGLALAAAILLVAQDKARTYAIVAAIVSAIDLAVALHLIQLSIPGIGLSVIMGAIMTVVGVLLLLRLERKVRVVAATVIVFAGAVELLSGLGLVH